MLARGIRKVISGARIGTWKPQMSCSALRFTSSLSSLQTSLYDELTSRQANIIFDYMTPMQSHLLNISLTSFLPPSCFPRSYQRASNTSTSPFSLPSSEGLLPGHLPAGHHLVYFPPQIPSHQLLPDGTDAFHSPGGPFVRRMWAGGSVELSNHAVLSEEGQRHVCIERVTDVSVKGAEGTEKIFVEIERHMLPAESSSFVSGRGQPSPEQIAEELKMAWTLERRNLVFMRQKSAEEAGADAGRVGKIVRSPHKPDFSVSLTPSQALLFRFSALTFNAHAIHLDREYARDVEGHRNLLVHGPLSLVLMLSVLKSQLGKDETIEKFDYRNLAPIYADEELKICMRRSKSSYEASVWIEGKEGGYAVKGTAILRKVSANVM